MVTDPAVEDALRRLRALEHRHQIERVLTNYGRALDYGLPDLFVDCFTADGVWRVRRRTGDELVVEGRTELHRVASEHSSAPAAFHKHVVSNIDVHTLSETDASVTSYFVRLDVDERPGCSPYVVATGRYLDELRLCEDGRWRFTSRLADVEDRYRDPEA